MLTTIVVVLVVLWLIGILVHIGGGFIHLVLLIALIVFVYDMLVKRRKT